MKQVGFKGSLQDFFKFMQNDPRFSFKDEPALLAHYRGAGSEDQPEASREQFSLMPKAPFEIRPVEAFRAQSAAGGQYYPPERGRLASRHLLRQHLRPAHAQDLGRRRPVPARGHPRPPLPDRAAAGTDQPAQVPPLRRRNRLRRRLGPVRRIAGQGPGRLHRSVPLLRLPAERAVARDPPGRRHRPAQQGLDPRAGDQVHARQLRRKRNPVHRRSRALHGHPRPGAGVQDRRTEDPGTARQAPRRRSATKFDVREFHAEVLKDGSVPLEVLEGKIDRWIAAKRG